MTPPLDTCTTVLHESTLDLYDMPLNLLQPTLLFCFFIMLSSASTEECHTKDATTCKPQSDTQHATLNTGYQLPLIALGVYQSTPGVETYNAVKWALELGYRHIDTAAMYQNEEDVGRAVRDSGIPRSEIFITTKFWPGQNALARKGSGYETAIEKGKESNAKLGLDYIDLYLIHAPAWGKERINVWRGLEELVTLGVVKSIGVSNYGVHHLEEIEEYTTPAVNQIELHPFMLHDDIEAYCREKDIRIEAYAPLVQATRLDNPTLVQVAATHGKTVAQILLRWGIDRGYIVLPKSVHKHRIAENKQLEGWKLDEEEVVLINGLNEYQGTSWDPTVWD